MTDPALARRRSANRLSVRRLHGLTAALSVAGHLLILLALISVQGDTPRPPAPEPPVVELVDPWPTPDI
ncbi:MAG TPA: hypothetical protein VF459_18680, partial [Caulobacteraceae bacterium]